MVTRGLGPHKLLTTAGLGPEIDFGGNFYVSAGPAQAKTVAIAQFLQYFYPAAMEAATATTVAFGGPASLLTPQDMQAATAASGSVQPSPSIFTVGPAEAVAQALAAFAADSYFTVGSSQASTLAAATFYANALYVIPLPMWTRTLTVAKVAQINIEYLKDLWRANEPLGVTDPFNRRRPDKLPTLDHL